MKRKRKNNDDEETKNKNKILSSDDSKTARIFIRLFITYETKTVTFSFHKSGNLSRQYCIEFDEIEKHLQQMGIEISTANLQILIEDMKGKNEIKKKEKWKVCNHNKKKTFKYGYTNIQVKIFFILLF
jgi:hypothetical protein